MKLFGKGGKLNIIDIILIVAVLAIVVFVFAAPGLLSGGEEDTGKNLPSAGADGKENLIFTVVCEDVDEVLANSIIRSLDGSNPLFSNSDVNMTRLYNNFKLVDAEVTAWDYADGELCLTVEGTAEYANGSFTVGTQGVRVGKSFIIKTLGVEIEGVVYTMEKNG